MRGRGDAAPLRFREAREISFLDFRPGEFGPALVQRSDLRVSGRVLTRSPCALRVPRRSRSSHLPETAFTPSAPRAPSLHVLACLPRYAFFFTALRIYRQARIGQLAYWRRVKSRSRTGSAASPLPEHALDLSFKGSDPEIPACLAFAQAGIRTKRSRAATGAADRSTP